MKVTMTESKMTDQPVPVLSAAETPWHAGRTVGKTLYNGDGPDDMVGVMMTRELAALVVERVNGYAALQEEVSRFEMERKLWDDHIEQAEAAHDQAQAEAARWRARHAEAVDMARDYDTRSQTWAQVVTETEQERDAALAARDQAQAERDAVLLELPAIADKLRAARAERDQAQAEAARYKAALTVIAALTYESEPHSHRLDVATETAHQALGGGEGA
jgi:chromosome segregation ATPase